MEHYLFDAEKLENLRVEAEEMLGLDLKKVQSVVSGKGIDDMTDEERFEEQKKSLGGSEIGELFGLGFHKENGPLHVYKTKKSETPEVIDEETQKMFDQGHWCEPRIFALIEKTLPEGWKAVLDKNRYRDVERDYLHADYDMIIIDPDGNEYIGEIKSYRDFPGKPKLQNGTLGEVGKNLLGHASYEWQVRHYMRERNALAGVVFSHPIVETEDEFSLDKLNHCVIYRDFDKDETMLKVVDDFWLNHVEKDVVPEFSSMNEDTFKQMLELLTVPYEKDKKGKLSPMHMPLIKQYCEINGDIANLKAEIKSYEQKIKDAENRQRALAVCIVQQMDNNEESFICDEGIVYKAKRSISVGRSTWDTKTLAKDHPELESNYKKPGKEKPVFEIQSWEDKK